MAVSLCQLIKSKVKIIKDAKSQCKIGVDSTQPTEFSPSSWRRGQDSESKSKKVKSDSLKCSRLLASLSPSLLPRLYHSLPPLLLSHCVFFWNRPSVMSTEISRHSAGASARLTFPLPVIYIREEAHGGFSMPAERWELWRWWWWRVSRRWGWMEPVPWGLTQ